jgi:hypothetical protein
MMTTERNATYLYIANVACGNATNAAELIFDDMPLGSAAIVAAESTTNGGHSAYTTTIAGSATQKLQIVNKMSTGEIRISPTFTYADIVGKTKQLHTPSQRQVSFLGYDGTTLAGLESVKALAIGDVFSIKLMFNDRVPYLNNCADIVPIPYYATDATAKTMATSIMNTVRSKFSGTNKPIICERIVAPTVANTVAAIAGGNLLYFTNGSKTVLAKDGATSSGVLTISAGVITTDFATPVISVPSYNGRTFRVTCTTLGTGGGLNLLIGTTTYTVADKGSAAQNAAELARLINLGTQATAVVDDTDKVVISYRDGQYYLPPVGIYDDADTNELYSVVAFDVATEDAVPVAYVSTSTFTDNATASFLLDVPWQGPTGYALRNSTTAATYAGTVTVDSDKWGLKFIGQMSDSLTPTTESYTVVDFDILAGEYLPTEYKAVAPFKGSGNWMQVKQMENYSQGLDRVNYYAPTEFDVRSYEAVSGKYYNMITLNINQRPYTSPTTGINISNPFTLVIAVSDKTAIAYDYMDAVVAV